MKTYFKIIQCTQKFFLAISILILLTLPVVLVFSPDILSENTILRLYDVSHIAVLLVMIVRPLADIFTRTTLIRPLVILRKGVGVFSASIIISFIFAKLIIDPAGYITAFGTIKYWSLKNFALLAHLADISAVFLLVTSNNFSKRILGTWWKRIQKISYVYFYASSLYVFFIFKNNTMLVSILLVTVLTMIAYSKNRKKLKQKTA